MNDDLIHINTLPPFKHMCCTIGNLPSSFMESMTYYEALCWLYEYFEKTLLPEMNNQGAAITELQEAFVTLKNYIDNYFENLDVQEEINNKLDAMAEAGTLEEIISTYLTLSGVISFNTVADMKEGTNLVAGSTVKTLGYYSIGDGGNAYYKIVDEVDENAYQETLTSTGLYANLIYTPNHINMKSVGCKADDNTFDNSTIINNIIEKFGKWFTYYFPNGDYYVNNPIVLSENHINIIGENERVRFIKTSANGVDITIETSKGTTYNLNNYDTVFYIGKKTSNSPTVTMVKLENISITCYDPTETSYGIIGIGCGYLKTNNIQLFDYNRAILLDDCFACNLDYVTALTFGSNRTAIEVLDSTAIYISNSYLNARYYSVKTNNSRVYIDKVACEAHGSVFLIEDDSYVDINNSRTETYAKVIDVNTESYVNVSNCDLEGHSSNFGWYVRARSNSKININNSLIRYQIYGEDTPPASIVCFDSETGSIINVNSYFRIYEGVSITNTATTGSLFITDLNSDGAKGTLTKSDNNITFTDTEFYVKDGYVHLYVSGNKSDGLTQNTSVSIATISGVPIPVAHAHRGTCGTSATNSYTTYNTAYFGINTSGELSITSPNEDQKYFVINTSYKIRP